MSLTHCDICGKAWDGHGTACAPLQTVTHDGITHPVGPMPTALPTVTFYNEAQRELEEVRAIFPKILEALGNGACCSKDSSVPFLKEIPTEVRLVVGRLKADLQRLRCMSAVEMMGENLNVKHHIEDWEKRCLKAEKERDIELERATHYRDEWQKAVEILRFIATPPRPDGTYNRCREACQKLAEEFLAGGSDIAETPFKVVCDETNNTSEDREKRIINAEVTIGLPLPRS